MAFGFKFQKGKLAKFLLVFLLTPFLLFLLATKVFAVTQDDCLNKSPSQMSTADKDECINSIIPGIIAQYAPAQEQNKKNLAGLQSQLAGLNSQIAAIGKQLIKFEDDITKREEDLEFTRKIFEEKTANHYRFLRTYDPISPFLAEDASTAFQEIIFRQKAADQDRQSIDAYANELTKLKEDKASLEKNKENLAAVQKQVSDKTSFLASEVAKVDSYLAALSAKQQAFIAAKLESLGISRSAYNLKGGCSSDVDPFKSPGFSPAIGFFTFGVPNRIGLNQFGAKGRAEAGQNYQQILQAYYSADISTGYGTGVSIHVTGNNEFGQGFDDTWNIDEYLKHLYEMPADWPMEALKAQAVAARSYALAYTNNGGGSICATQQCQVVKRELNNGNWQAAVDATKGVVLTSGGSPAKAWYSSTHGGYVFSSSDIGWSGTAWTKRAVDTSGSVNSFSDLMSSAYDRNSPVFYCDWGGRSSYNNTAWLKADEVADIMNVALLAQKDGSIKSHLYQVDKANPEGTDTWDAARVRSELSNRGVTPLSNADSVSVGVDFSSGRTTSVNINGVTINAGDFKDYFNLRAPANIQIVGPLFNVEKR